MGCWGEKGRAKGMRRAVLSLLIWGWGVAMAQNPATDGVAAQKSVERGGKLVQVCANCHGANGNSRNADTPNLAGQNAAYLHEQMRRFVDGRRKDPFMQGMIKAMNATERNDVVAFLASQTVQPQDGAAVPATQLAHGKRYYEKVCFRCHGPQALGDAAVPRLAGQQPGYVVKSLKRYRDGTGERLEPLMAANTKLMSDDDIAAVAAYVSSMR